MAKKDELYDEAARVELYSRTIKACLLKDGLCLDCVSRVGLQPAWLVGVMSLMLRGSGWTSLFARNILCSQLQDRQ